MLNSISRLGETRPEQEWSNGTEFSGYFDFPEKRVHSKRIPKFSKTFPGIFTVPFNLEPEISEILAEWKAPKVSVCGVQCVVYHQLPPQSSNAVTYTRRGTGKATTPKKRVRVRGPLPNSLLRRRS